MAVETLVVGPVPPQPLHNFKGLPISIDPTKPPKNYNASEAMKRRAEWQVSYNAEYAGFTEQGAFKIDHIRPGDVILETTTRNNYKAENDNQVQHSTLRARRCAGTKRCPGYSITRRGFILLRSRLSRCCHSSPPLATNLQNRH